MSRWTRKRRAAGLPLGETILVPLPFTPEDRRTLRAIRKGQSQRRDMRRSLRFRRASK